MAQPTTVPTTAKRFALTPAEIASLLASGTRNSLEGGLRVRGTVQQQLREKMDAVFASVSDYVEIHSLLEMRFSEALRAQRERDLAQASYPRVGAEAMVEIETRAAVLQWVLEMLPSPSALTADSDLEGQALDQRSGMTLAHALTSSPDHAPKRRTGRDELDGLLDPEDESKLLRHLALRSPQEALTNYPPIQR